MAKNLSDAQANYERKTQNAASQYASGINGASGRWAQGMSDFLGAPVSAGRVSAYQSGLAGAPEKYARGVQGKGNKWAENLRRKMTQ